MGLSSDMQTASAEQLRGVLVAANILLADHEPGIADIVTNVLKRYGASAIERATSADEALDMLGYTTRPYDLVMLRAGLPNTEALQVLRVLSRQLQASRLVTKRSCAFLESQRPERLTAAP